MVVLELVDARVGDLGLGVVYDGRPLVVAHVEALRLEAERPPREMPEPVAEELVDRARVVDGDARQRVAADPKRSALQPHGGVAADLYPGMVEEPLEERVVAGERNPLVVVVEVVDVVAGTHGHALDYGRVDLLRRTPPLLRGVSAEEGVEHRLRARLVAQERVGLAGLQLHAEELLDEREAQRQEIRLPAVAGEDLVLVAVELHETVHELPDLRYVGVEDVGAVGVDFDAGLGVGLAPHVPPDGIAALEDEHPSA